MKAGKCGEDGFGEEVRDLRSMENDMNQGVCK